jgi:hypothetical protein
MAEPTSAIRNGATVQYLIDGRILYTVSPPFPAIGI